MAIILTIFLFFGNFSLNPQMIINGYADSSAPLVHSLHHARLFIDILIPLIFIFLFFPKINDKKKNTENQLTYFFCYF